jgi:dsDNA-specific endonuclease/ATPase MutS2
MRNPVSSKLFTDAMQALFSGKAILPVYEEYSKAIENQSAQTKTSI